MKIVAKVTLKSSGIEIGRVVQINPRRFLMVQGEKGGLYSRPCFGKHLEGTIESLIPGADLRTTKEGAVKVFLERVEAYNGAEVLIEDVE